MAYKTHFLPNSHVFLNQRFILRGTFYKQVKCICDHEHIKLQSQNDNWFIITQASDLLRPHIIYVKLISSPTAAILS